MKFSEIKNLDTFLYKVSLDLDLLKILSPKNISYEKKQFLNNYIKDKKYEPKFIYEISPTLLKRIINYSKILKDLYYSMDDKSFLNEFYKHVISDCLKTIEIICAISNKLDHNFVRIANSLYCWPNNEVLISAKMLLKNNPIIKLYNNDEAQILGPNQLKRNLEKRLSLYNIKWKVDVTIECASRIVINPFKKYIGIREDAFFSKREIKKLLVHEIDTHILRAENGEKCWDLGIFSFGFPGSEEIDEGLALFNEHKLAVNTPDVEKILALHVIGIDFSSQHSFYETFQWVTQYFENNLDYIFNRVLRWKRGISNQQEGGMFCKDIVYFRGFQTVISKITENNYKKLYLGRLSFREVENHFIEKLESMGLIPSIKPILPIYVNNWSNFKI